MMSWFELELLDVSTIAEVTAAFIRPLMQKEEQLSTGWTRAETNDILRDYNPQNPVRWRER